jgi:spermidine synthase
LAFWIDSGVTSLGFTTTALPLTRAAMTSPIGMTNGKFQGNDSEEVQDNRGFAYLPALFAKNKDNALVIGLGTGTTTGAVSAFGFKSVDVAELSPAITDYAGTTFKKVNRNVLGDPRVHVLLEDGRNVLLLGNKRYDLITIEVTSIWFAGAANLYNREFYRLVNMRLSDGGFLQQWLQLHHTNRRTVATIIATMREAFPHMALFVTGHQGNMIAGRAPLTASRANLKALGEDPNVSQILGDERLVDYVKGIVLDETGIDKFLAGKFRGAYEDSLVAEFKKYLPSTPPWKTGKCC